MSISVIRKRDVIRTVLSRHLGFYAPGFQFSDGRTASEIQERLARLDLETCSAEQVNAAMGTDSWTSLRCDECELEVDAVAGIGGKRYCLDCLRAAVQAVEKTRVPSDWRPGCGHGRFVVMDTESVFCTDCRDFLPGPP